MNGDKYHRLIVVNVYCIEISFGKPVEMKFLVHTHRYSDLEAWEWTKICILISSPRFLMPAILKNTAISWI